MSNSIGEKFRITSFGSSHGKALGAVVDGCPANLELTVEDIQKELDKRKPGTSSVTTPRKEGDEVQILSGIFEGKTDGTPITGVVFNKNQHSKDYSMFKNTPRPSHGDFGWMMKYGNYDYNGGGRGSGRVTIGHVIGGAVAKKLLETKEIEIISHVTQIGDITADPQDFNAIKENIEKNPIRCADLKAAKEIAVKGVEIGLGFDVAKHLGSQINDEYQIENNQITTKTNNSGGIIGGMSNGMPIISRIAVKPTPSISKCQDSINLEKRENEKIEIKGRHDPCICPRVTAVAESSTAIVLADHMIRSGFIHPTNLKN